ncbi:hypothetical protein [Enterobacter cloacae]|uniref:Uncharacterized protein n=1 Tax=Enterobacter cloacae TaxID=550 RepID=A0A6S5JTV1_ENTCL|nr:hypothetical protein [Enterobacter cloacae]BBS32872.1 hypothetical protein WP5S18C02_30780 [Enterobacter cloacae]
MSVKRYEVNGSSSVFENENGSLVDYEDYAALEARCTALAAENGVLLAIMNEQAGSFGAALAEGFHDAVMESGSDQLIDIYQRRLQPAIQCIPPTPDTDAFLAEVRAQGRNEGINYAASRLAAAFNHGFVDKPLAEVFDVVRMIMDTKEELENSILPAADGLSGGYAEKFLTEFAGYARKGEEPEEGKSFLSDEDCQALVKAFTKGAAQ